MNKILLFFLASSFSEAASFVGEQWMHRESRSILGRPRLNKNGKKQVGLDVFLFHRDFSYGSFIAISNWAIKYEFETEIEFKKDEWFVLEMPHEIYDAEAEAEDKFDSFLEQSYIPVVLRTAPNALKMTRRKHSFGKLSAGSTFVVSFEGVVYNIKAKTEPKSEKEAYYFFKIDGFRPLKFKFEKEPYFNTEACDKVYRTFFEEYVFLLKTCLNS